MYKGYSVNNNLERGELLYAMSGCKINEIYEVSESQLLCWK